MARLTSPTLALLLTTTLAILLGLHPTTTATLLVHAAPQELSQVTIYTPPDDYTDPRVLYARTAQLPNNDILATWENYSHEPPAVYFPIYKSTDAGATWTELSRVEDQGYGYGLRYQPFLYVLPEAFAGWDAGTVLLAGSSIPTDLSSTQLDLYASADGGATWAFLSHVAAGGVAEPTDGLTPVWEPFLLLPPGGDRLLYYYSDQRDNATHGQKLVHQTSADLRTWADAVDDVAYPAYTDRPGMPTLARLPPSGQYIYTYEYGGGEDPTSTSSSDDDEYTFPVYYRLSADPEAFADAEHHVLQSVSSSDGTVTVPNGSPYVVWSPAGGENGTIVVSSGCCSEIFINRALGAEDAWETVDTPEGVSYTRSLLVLQDDPAYVMIAGAGALPPSEDNSVTVSVMDINIE